MRSSDNMVTADDATTAKWFALQLQIHGVGELTGLTLFATDQLLVTVRGYWKSQTLIIKTD